jgi:hypothetical protein
MYRAVAISFVTVICLSTDHVQAGEIAPGGTGSSYEDFRMTPPPPDAEWQGPLLAERRQPFRVEWVNEFGAPSSVEGVFASRVYRDPGTGGLAFQYALEETGQVGIYDLEEVYISGFGRTGVDLYTTTNDFQVRRSADGDLLSFTFDQSSFDSFLVRSDSPAFRLNAGGFTFDLDFPPDSQDVSTSFDAYAPVPEPSAAALPLTAAGLTLLRRTRGTRR